MSGLQNLPPEVLTNIHDFLNFDGLKNLRATCKQMRKSVDQYLLLPQSRKRVRCVVNGYASGSRLSSSPPKFPHSTLILDIPFADEFDSFYRLDFSLYLKTFAHNVTRLECNWFLGLATYDEFIFLNAFENLESLVFFNVCDESVFDFLIMTIPKCINNVANFTSTWSPVFLSLQWLRDPSFRPKSLNFLDIESGQVVRFFKEINGYLKLCREFDYNLKSLHLDEYCVTHDVEFPVDVLVEFATNTIGCNLEIEGVSSALVYKIEHVVDKYLFEQFLKCLKSVHGLHPTMRKERMENLHAIKLKENSNGLQDFRWTKYVGNRILPNLKSVNIGIEIDVQSSNPNRRVECKSVLNMIEACLGNEAPKMTKLILKVQKPEWYPLYIPLDFYVKNFPILKELDLTLHLNSKEVGRLFKSLQFSKVESIKLTDCQLSDELFKMGSFLRLTNLTSFSVTCEDPCTQQFFSDDTFFDVLSRSSLVKLQLKGSFPLVTANGIRFIAFGQKIGSTINLFRFQTQHETSEIRQAVELVRKRCEKNIARL